MLQPRAEHQQPETPERTDERTPDHHVGLILDGDRVIGVEREPDRKPQR